MLQEGGQEEGGKKVGGDDVSLHEGGQEIVGKEVGGDGVSFHGLNLLASATDSYGGRTWVKTRPSPCSGHDS